ncbi:hypothetical protein [Mesoflavibacter sp. SCSIO 43206]|uniref:hypothetical protein n=1 Tax=Mesoflavibacter sp. SCSIO 43206 TaxID=2779362 RepID=UPI001CA9DD70|nr:hypothetical protein [Mesoflavibacter sp. SCSIO 43206]UAB75139.1 hypothetical protein INR78_12215 [Mesoflavibacter sp. SCSIO 43206]
MKIIVENSIKNTESLNLLNLAVLIKSVDKNQKVTFDEVTNFLNESEYRKQTKIAFYSDQNNEIITFVCLTTGDDLFKIVL